MKHVAKKIFPKPILSKITHRNIKDDDSELVYVHIGKCGGESLWDAINSSKVIQKDFSRVHKVHIRKPPIHKKTKYLVVVRNPISRAVSAFNWRYKLVVEDETQRHRFKGEWEVLTKYKTLNTLAERLYKNGELDDQVAKDFESILHLRENIQFYLNELLDKISDDQIYGVMSTETLSEDVVRQLDVRDLKRTHENAKFVDKSKKYLSETAHENLRRYLSDDFRCLETLLARKNTTVCEISRLLG